MKPSLAPLLAAALGALVAAGPSDAAPQKHPRPREAQPPAPTPTAAPSVPAPAAAESTAPAPTPSPQELAVRDVALKLDRYQTKAARDAVAALPNAADPDAPLALALGRLLDQERKVPDAVAMLQKAVALAPADPAPEIALGDVLMKAQKGGEANAAWQKAADLAAARVAANASDADAWRALGTAQLRLKQADPASASLEKARTLDGGDPRTLFPLALTRGLQERWADSVDLLSSTVEKDPAFALAYYYRALAQDKVGRKDRMVIDLDTFVKLAPSSVEADRAKLILAAARR